MIEKLFTFVADKSVIVLISHMTNELIVIQLGTLRHCLNRSQADFSLEFVILHIGQIMGRQKKVP